MANHFDPYRAWLGIASKGRPPDHYQLLGLQPFESDPRTITVTAEAQMDRVKPFLEGTHAQEARRLLDEIFAARNCLLRLESKTRYDGQIRFKGKIGPAEVRPRPQADARLDEQQPVIIEGADEEAGESLARRMKQQPSRPFWRSQFAQIVLGGIGGVLVAATLIVLLHSRGKESSPVLQVPATQRSADRTRPQAAKPASREAAPVTAKPASAQAVAANAESAVGLDGQEGAREVVAAAARQIAETLLTAARRAKNAPPARQLAGWEQEMQRLEKGFAAFQEAQAVLAGDPSNADANLTAGRWQGFVKGDWKQALPLLAKGSDPLLAQLARQDLAGPSDPESQMSLAGVWWRQSLKETGPLDGRSPRRLLVRPGLAQAGGLAEGRSRQEPPRGPRHRRGSQCRQRSGGVGRRRRRAGRQRDSGNGKQDDSRSRLPA
jgi:hypothetical protein